MSEINWNEAPEWADRVVRSPGYRQLFWVDDLQWQSLTFGYRGMDNQHVREKWEVVARRPAHFPDQLPETFMCRCVAEPVSRTIEQRIASLRALEKQVEETRAELTRDLEALGLTRTVNVETTTTITDWRELRVGDIVAFDGVDGEWGILNLEDEYDGAPIKVSENIIAECIVEGWPNIAKHPWRFIRRP